MTRRRFDITSYEVSPASGERGTYIPLFAFILVAVLLFLGIVIDIGTIARARIQLHKATDAGVLGGLAFRLRSGPSTPTAEVETRAQKYVEQNLQAYGISLTDPQLTLTRPTFNNATTPETLSVGVSYRAPLILLPYVPTQFLNMAPSPDRFLVTAASQGQVPRANVVLLVDLSSSMWCPANSSDCSCLTNSASMSCDTSASPGVAKVYELRRAIYRFLSSFRQGWDRISMITFDTISTTAVSFDRDGDGVADGFQLTDFAAAMGADGAALPAGFQPGALTNPSDAFMRAYDMLQTVRLSNAGPTMWNNTPVAIVYSTDGAPTAETGCFANTRASLPPYSATPACPNGGKRYTHMEFQYRGLINGVRLRTLSPPYRATDLAAYARQYRDPSQFAAMGYVQPACGAVAMDMATSNGNCFNDLSHWLPSGGLSESGLPLTDYKAGFYFRTLALAQFFQQNRATVYTIGLGPLANPPQDPKVDLLEDPRDDEHRKDGFLLLASNDLKKIQQQLKPASGPYPSLGFSDFQTIEGRLQADANAEGATGEYVAGFQAASTPSQKGLDQLFGQIAQRILVRLTL